MILVIGGVTAAAVSFGSKVNEKRNHTEPATESQSISTSSAEVTEAFNPDYSSNVPVEIQKFAYINDLSTDLWPDEIIELLKKNPETEEFVLNYPLLKDEEFKIDISDSVNNDSVPHFLQWDTRWGYAPYGDDIIANAGCGPTCLSMVYVYLTGDTSMNPKAMAGFSTEYGYCVPGNGSSWSLIYEGGEYLGLDVWELPLVEDYIIENLQNGNPVICVMGPGDFTDGGHFIVMTDYIDGQIKINDPNSIIRTNKLWNYSDIEDQIENLWACSTY